MPSGGVTRRTSRPGLEIADILRRHRGQLGPVSPHVERTVEALLACRTARLGGHVRRCDACGHQEIAYNSCRNRHCPKCQGLEAVRWLEAQRAKLLPIGYHHVVFTVPPALHRLFRMAPRLTYNLLFQVVAETLIEVARRRRNLGARIGFTAVLHTWSQTLLFHPHLHCLVTGGGLSPDGTRWVRARPRFLFSVRILSRLFRAKLLRRLQRAVDLGTIPLPLEQARPVLRRAARKPWVVYSKPPFAGPEQVLSYLGRYTHRIAISNHRLVAATDDEVTFHWRDRADGDRRKTMTLGAGEFLRRFLLHVVPPAFQRIRHYGLLANGVCRLLLTRCRTLLDVPPGEDDFTHPHVDESWRELLIRLCHTDPLRCPRCRTGTLREIRHLKSIRVADRSPPEHVPTP